MKRRYLAAGLLAGCVAFTGWTLYRRRPVGRLPGPEGLEDPAIARGYGWVARTPQMALMRLLVAARASAMKTEGSAIDLGCGPGLLAVKLAQLAPGLHVTGVDLSPEMLDQGEEHAATAGLGTRVDFRLGDAAAIPFPDGSLDLVVSTLSLHHWSEPIAVLDEIVRVLRPGGGFFVADLRRDLPMPSWLLLWFATHVVVPRALRSAGEPLNSRNAAYTPEEVADLAARSELTGWRVSRGPLWLILEGFTSS